jgi:hypothetical protein
MTYTASRRGEGKVATAIVETKSVATIPLANIPNAVGIVVARVTGMSGQNAFATVLAIGFTTDGSGNPSLGTVSTVLANSLIGLLTAAVVVAVSGSNININATGIAATAINWDCEWDSRISQP